MLKRTTLLGTMLPYGFFVCLLLLPAGLWAQCGFLNKQENGNTYYPRTTNQTVGIGNAAFLRFGITNGDNTSYAFNLCGVGYDAQLTGFNGGTALFYNDDNNTGGGACTNCVTGSCTPTNAPSLTWTSTFTGTLNVQANRYNCLDWGSGIGSATLNYRCNAPTTPAIGTAGNGTWNIYCYDAGDAAGGSGAWSSNYSGYYTDNTLGFNTATRWANTPYEANATGGQAYRGCYILPDNHSWRAIRTNIPCGAYQLQVNHDDIGQVFINGVSVYNNATCCASTNVGTFVISPSDVIEYRVSEGGGGSGGQIAFNSAASTLNAGTITYGGSTAACGSYDPPAFGSSAAASGGASAAITNVYGQGIGTSTYQWQVNGGDIGGATALTYDAPNITTAGTYVYRRRVTDECGVVAYTNTFTITITAVPTAASNTTSNAAICETSSKALVGSPAGGTWTVQSGGGSIAGTTYTPADVLTATSVTVRYTIAAVGPCPATFSDVTFTVDASNGTASNTTSNAAICENSSKALTGTPAGGSWSVVSGGGSIAGTTYTPANVLTATSVTVRYTIAASGTCPGSTSDVSFTVDADPGTANNTTSNAAICETSSKALTGTPAGGSWSVVSGGGSIAGTTYTPANVLTATSVTIRYTIGASGTCAGSTSDVTFTVDASNGTASNTTSNAAICENSSKALTGTPAGGSWSVVSGGGSIAGTTYTPANVTSATSVTIRYSIAASGTCPGSTSDVSFTVDADPGTASNTTSNAAICETSSKALTGTPGGGSWSVVSGGGAIAGTTYTPANVTSATSVTIRYSIAASGTCPGSTSDVSFTVDADPGTASNTTSNAAICENSSKALTGTPAGGSWSVVSGGGAIAGTTYTPANVTSATSVTVRYTIAASGTCPGSTSDVSFTVDADPGTASNTTSNAAICETSSKALTGTPGGGSWSVVSGGGAIAGTTYTPANVTSATSVTIRYTIPASGTCAGSTSDVTFTVDADPGTASNTTSSAAICETSNKALTATPAGGSWSVVSGGGAIAGTTYTPANVTSATSVTIRYSVAASGNCPGSTSDVTFTVDADPGTASNTTSNADICETASKALVGTPAGGSWTVQSGGGSIAGTTYTPANVTSATSVTIRYAIAGSGACAGSTSDVTFTVNPIPAAFSPAVVTTTPLCFGGNAKIDFPGESGVSYQLRDVSTNVNGPGSGPGTVELHTNNLTANSSTYNVLATAGVGSCTLNVSVPTITVSATPTALANNNDARTCYINGNNAYVEFFSANGSIIAINPGTQNLGDVTVTEFVGGPLGVQACFTSPTAEPQFNTATLGRHWTISSTVAPSSNLNVRLYFSDADVAALAAASIANVNTLDNVSTSADMELSKYSGANENSNFADNCGNGTVTLHPQVGSGAMTSGNIGYNVNSAGYTVHTVSSFSELWLSGTNNVSPLPIELTSFAATCADGSVLLVWETASEINNEKFLVERSPNLQVWEEVTVLPGAGNSNQPLHYQITDERPLQGLSYYRLTQRDYDGKSETFTPISITCYSDGKGNSMMVYPNPATHVFNVSVTATETTSGKLELLDANGKTLLSQGVNLVEGGNTFSVSAETLNPGTYVIYLRTQNLDLKPVKVLVIK